MKITEQHIVGDLVVENYKAAEVFKKYGIDFCCGGQQSIQQACSKENLPPESANNIVKELTDVLQKESQKEEGVSYDQWSLDTLADHIEKVHHSYVEAKIPMLVSYLEKIAAVHGNHHPELFEINDIFKKSAGQLAMHMKKEEIILFPFIRKMEKAKRENTEFSKPPFQTIKNPIRQMDDEHHAEGEAFRKIASLSNNYTVPDDGCNTYRVAFGLLKEFEEDLHLHIHKENNILFKRAIELEEELLS